MGAEDRHEILEGSPTHKVGELRLKDGSVRVVPDGWAHLPPGDAGLTRRVKAAGPYWLMKALVGKRLMSRGLWAPAATIEAERARLEAERLTPAYKASLAKGRARREAEQAAYEKDFARHVEAFLAFHPRFAEMARELAARVTRHAVPVGSGTVARTSRIPIAERAEAAVIAWLRHQTTTYDMMHIGRVKGERREVRRELARASRRLLSRYRDGRDPEPECPLARALKSAPPEAPEPPAPARPRPRAALRPAAAPAAEVPEEDARAQRQAAVRARLKRG